MTKYLLLVKTLLRQRFRFDKYRANGKRNWTWIALVIAGVCMLPLLLMIISSLYNVGSIAQRLGITKEVITYLITGLQVVVFMFGIGGMIGTVYFGKDVEMLLSTPIKARTVYAAKLTCVYIYELITGGALTFALFIPFGLGADFSVLAYLQLIPVALIQPMLPLLLCAIIAIPIMSISNYFKNKGVALTIIYMLLFALAFGGYYYFIGNLTNGSIDPSNEAIAELFQKISSYAKYILPNMLLAQTLVAANFAEFALGALGAIGSNGVLLIVTLLITNAVYNRNVSRQLESPKLTMKSNAKEDGKKHGKLYYIVLDDFKRLIRDNSMGLYCLLQIVLVPIISGFLVSQFGSSEGMGSEEFFIIQTGLPIFVCAFFGFMAYTCNYTATGAFTREHQNYYVMKMLPVDAYTFTKGKVILANLFNYATFIVTVVVVTVIGKFQWYTALLMLIQMSIYGSATVNIQVLIDLAKPRLNWNSFAEGAKNNPASLWSLLIGFLSMIVVGGVGILGVALYANGLNWALWVMWALVIAVGIAFYFITDSVVKKKCQGLFDRIE